MDVPSSTSPNAAFRAAFKVGGFCAIVQIASAIFLVRGFDTPNFATRIARNLAATGEFSGGEWWRLKGPNPPAGQPAMRAFHLPGEPLYLAAGLRVLPESCHRFLHVPVTALLVASLTFAAASMFGARAGWLAGLFASIQPFVVMHGPVWDDTFTATALEWAILALVIFQLDRKPGWIANSVVFLCAGFAALTRSQSQIVLVGVALAWIAWPRTRFLWPQSLAILLGIAVAVGGWGVRNQTVLGEFLVGSTHDGITLWESNYPSAIEALVTRGQVERLNSERMLDDFAHTANLSELQADRYFRTRAMDYLKGHPAAILNAAATKLWYTSLGIRPEEPVDSNRNLAALAANLILLGLAIAGLAAMFSQTAAPSNSEASITRNLVLWYAVATAGSSVLLTVIGPVGMRYRIGCDAFFWIASGIALDRLVTFWKAASSVFPSAAKSVAA